MGTNRFMKWARPALVAAIQRFTDDGVSINTFNVPAHVMKYAMKIREKKAKGRASVNVEEIIDTKPAAEPQDDTE